MSWKKSTGARTGYELQEPHSCQSQTVTSHMSSYKDHQRYISYDLGCAVFICFFPNVFAFHFAGPLRESHHENDHPEENVAEETETRMVHKGTDAEHFGMDCVDFSVVFSFDIRLCYVKIYPTKYSECLPTLLALMYMSSRAV